MKAECVVENIENEFKPGAKKPNIGYRVENEVGFKNKFPIGGNNSGNISDHEPVIMPKIGKRKCETQIGKTKCS